VRVTWGVVIVALSMLAWGGQTVVWFAPSLGVKLGLSEAESDVDPPYWADVRGEARWDVMTLWTLVVAGVLLIVDNAAWAYFGLVGGGMYVYFAGRGISTRIALRRGGFRVGNEASVKLGFIALAVWGVMGMVLIIAAAQSLEAS